jgi:hypothetical protein
LAHHRAREPVWGWLFYVFTGGLLNTKAWGYVTDILGGAVYVVYVDGVEIVRRLDAPIAWPHTVIFVDRGVAERLEPAVAPRIVYNFTYSGVGVWGSPASVLGGHLWEISPLRASWRRA